MKILLEFTILTVLNLFLFGVLQRKMAILVLAQRNQIIVLKRSVKSRRSGNVTDFFGHFSPKFGLTSERI